MVFLLAAIHFLVLFAVAFQIYRKQTILRKAFWPALTIKLLCGVCVGLLYTYYYPGSDTFVYFGDASKLASLARTEFPEYLEALLYGGDPGLGLTLTEPRSLFFTRIASVFSLLAAGNYWVIAVYFSFISFLGSWFLAKKIATNLPASGAVAAAAFLFLPSAVFWTSGFLKESLAIASLLYLSGIFVATWFDNKIAWGHVVLGLFALWVLWNLKYFYAGIFVATLCTTLLYRLIWQSRIRSAALEVIVWVLLLIVLLVPVTFLHPNFHVDRLLTVIIANNAAYVELSDTGDYVRFQNLAPTLPAILLNSPWAFFSGLFRPLFWEASSGVQLLAGIENALLFILGVGSLLKSRVYVKSPHRLLILTVIVYVILLSVLITLSAPNFGTLSRYRTGYITFFTFLVLCNNPLFKYVERSFTGLLASERESTFKL